MKARKTISEFLWYIGLKKSNICPRCQSEMYEKYSGYTDFSFSRWECRNENCNFTKK